MASNFPTSLDTATQQPSPTATTEMDDVGFEHHTVHVNHSEALLALEAKMGIGASNAASATNAHVLTHTAGGATAWTAPGHVVVTDSAADAQFVLAGQVFSG